MLKRIIPSGAKRGSSQRRPENDKDDTDTDTEETDHELPASFQIHPGRYIIYVYIYI